MLTINKIEYQIISSKTPDQIEADGMVNLAREMRKGNVKRDLALVRPKSKKMFQCMEYMDGTFSAVTFIGYL